MPICLLVCSFSLSLCLINAVVANPFMSLGLKQSLLKITNETANFSTKTWDFHGESTTEQNNGTSSDDVPDGEVVDMLSVLWYLGAFGGLVTFFVIVTCSEWCFGNHMYTRHGINELYVNAYQSNFQENRRQQETPPPPYDLFAPPSYADLFGKEPANTKKSKLSIFIIPIHRRNSSAAS